MNKRYAVFTAMYLTAVFATNAAPAYAGGEDYFGLSIGPTSCYRAGYFRTPVRSGTRCTLTVSNSLGAMSYRIQYLESSTVGWKNLTTKRKWIDGNGDFQESIVITVTRTRAYRVVADFKDPNSPNKSSSGEQAIFVK